MNINLRQYTKLLKKYLGRYKHMVVFLFISTISVIVFNVLKPKVLGLFVDGADNRKSVGYLYLMAVFYFVCIVMENLSKILMQYFTENLGWNSTNDLRTDLTEHLMNLDMEFHKKFSAGQLVERIDGDINQLFVFFTTFMTGLVLNGLLLLASLGYLLYIDYRFFLITLVFNGIVGVYLAVISKTINKNSAESREYASSYQGAISEQVTSLEDIKAFNAGTHMRNQLRSWVRKWSKSYTNEFRYELYTWGFIDIVYILNIMVVLVLAAYFVSRNIITVGTAFIVFNVLRMATEPMVELTYEIMYIESADASMKRIQELKDAKRSITQGTLDMDKDSDLKVENLSFSYEKDEPILKNLSFNLESHKILGILGRTGSGKTTLARLLVKLYEPQEGTIEYGNKNLKEISDESLRKNIAYVTQDTHIFNATLRDNIRLYDEDITDEMILKVIKDIGIEEWFSKLKDGLNTVFSDDSKLLSPGEMQLLVMVRLFLKKPEILILDEATARLDPLTEKYLERALDKLLKGRTTIIIAHRLKTLLRSDNLIILDKGEIIEKGKREKLMKDENSTFSRLLKIGLEEVLV